MTSSSEWLKRLTKEPLPILASSREAALRLIDDNRASIADITREFSRDPILCHHAVVGAWIRQRTGGKDREIRTLEQALNLIGLKALEERLKKVPVIRAEDQAKPEIQAYLAAAMQSQYAAEQAYQWAVVQLWKGAEEVWLASLLYNQLGWYLSLRGAEALAACATDLRNHQTAAATEQRLFGTPLIQMAGRLTEQLCPLEILNSAYDSKALPDVRAMAAISAGDPEAVRYWSSRPTIWIAFANHMAGQALSHGLNAHLTKRLRLIAGLLRLSEEKAWEYLRTLAIKVSTETVLPTQTPAARLLMLPSSVKCAALTLPLWLDTTPPPAPPAPPAPPKPVKPEAATPAVQRPAPARPTTRQPVMSVYKEYSALLHNHPEEFSDLHELMNFLAMGLHYGGGLDRVEILLLNPDRTALISHYHAGLTTESPLRRLRIGIGNNPLLRKLLEAPACLHIDAASGLRYWQHVPDPLKLALGKPEVSMMAMFANGRPVALVIADREGKTIPAGQREAMKRLVQQAMDTLQQMAERRRATPPQQKAEPPLRPAVPR